MFPWVEFDGPDERPVHGDEKQTCPVCSKKGACVHACKKTKRNWGSLYCERLVSLSSLDEKMS